VIEGGAVMPARISGEETRSDLNIGQQHRARVVVIVACSLTILLFIIAVIAATLFNKPLALIVIAGWLALLLGVLIIKRSGGRIVQFIKRTVLQAVQTLRSHKKLTIAGGVIAILGLVALALVPPVSGPIDIFALGRLVDIASVPYTATMTIEGNSASINERITIDKQSREYAYAVYGVLFWKRG
jgi:hypothetical protein